MFSNASTEPGAWQVGMNQLISSTGYFFLQFGGEGKESYRMVAKSKLDNLCMYVCVFKDGKHFRKFPNDWKAAIKELKIREEKG